MNTLGVVSIVGVFFCLTLLEEVTVETAPDLDDVVFS
jgi:hypothetical protein